MVHYWHVRHTYTRERVTMRLCDRRAYDRSGGNVGYCDFVRSYIATQIYKLGPRLYQSKITVEIAEILALAVAGAKIGQLHPNRRASGGVGKNNGVVGVLRPGDKKYIHDTFVILYLIYNLVLVLAPSYNTKNVNAYTEN